jgi:16S rRNA (guanine527-N7)-methyltransferase
MVAQASTWAEQAGAGLEGAAWARVDAVCARIAEYAPALGLTGARTAHDLAEHVVEACLGLAVAREAGAVGSWLDVGSGGGLPGLVVAAAWPWEVVLVEPRARRAAFLELVTGEIGRGRVVRGRLEASGLDRLGPGRGIAADAAVASARAVFSPQRWLELGRRRVLPGGLVLVSQRPDDPDVSGGPVLRKDWGRWSVRGYVRS